VTAGDHTVHLYAARCEWRGSTAHGYEAYERGHLGWAPPARSRLSLSADPSFRGSEELLNPEQLVLLAASSCQLLSFLAVASRSRIDVHEYLDDAVATMPAEAARLVSVELRPRITVGGPASRARLVRAVEVAHDECYVARSLNCPVTVRATFRVDG
jgi:organic hydroperoxide reductase OsmC/OhrA